MTPNWLQQYLEESIRQDLCTKIYCTTCGAMEFRKGLLHELARATGRQHIKELDRDASLQIAKKLAQVQPITADSERLEEAVRCILFELSFGFPSLDDDAEKILAGSWAGDILSGMQKHDQARQAKRNAHEEYNSPANIQQRKDENKRIKQEQHEHRLDLKKTRDLVWHEEHEKG